MAYGGSVGTLTYIDSSQSDHEKCNAHALLVVTEHLPKYASRDMKRTFIDKYTDVAKCSAMVLRHIYRELAEDASAPCSQKQADIDIRVAQFFLSADDTDLVLDLRVLNGKSGNSLAAQPLAKNGGSGNTTILKLFCRNAINKLRGWWETL